MPTLPLVYALSKWCVIVSLQLGSPVLFMYFFFSKINSMLLFHLSDDDNGGGSRKRVKKTATKTVHSLRSELNTVIPCRFYDFCQVFLHFLTRLLFIDAGIVATADRTGYKASPEGSLWKENMRFYSE